ncbi:G protein-coupled receptor kinase 5 [Brachionichthys hirsutus]|uniref:G protein-coupled receptor kinase 5 n=1 Tax=Brachionichthys hirsutus TaxID=412623 RepID=UPI003604F924
MEIDSMVANSALIRAREGGGSKGRSCKWREMLRFPQINQCVELAINIERDYYSLCVKQPIGKKLFELFCQSRPDLKKYTFLQDALEEFERKADENRREFGLGVVGKFLNTQSKQCIPIILKHEQSCSQSLEFNPYGDVFKDCSEDLHKFLSGEPFVQYQDSLYFDRFLQWKALERKPVTKHDFKQYRLLGKGGFGEVWACQVRATGMMYACKKLEKTHVKKRKGEAMALNEKQILEGVDSRFVVNLAYSYETKHTLCMVLTMMSGGDLKFHIYSMGGPGLDRDRARFYAAEVCCGLIHLHQKSILYRDVKPENILLDENGHIRISDLGLAVRLTEKRSVRGRVGTLGYMAPEVIGNKYYGASTDWWGFGCLVYEMTAGQPPFRRKGEHVRSSEMERRIHTEKEEYGEKFSKDVKDICTALLTKDPKERLGCGGTGGKEVQSHPFFQPINFRMLEAGLVEPSFKPDPRLVYCSDVQDIDEFSSVKGVTLDEIDEDFYSKFNTGRVPVAWQNEVIETGCFKELNTFGPGGSRSPDLDWCQIPDSPKRGLLQRIFRRHHPNDPQEESKQSLMSDDAYMKSALSSMSL